MLAAGCGATETQPRPIFELELELVNRARVPDSVQLVGIALAEAGSQLVAWGPDQPGYWTYALHDREAVWKYSEPLGWSGTLGVLSSSHLARSVIVDSIMNITTGTTGVTAAPERWFDSTRRLLTDDVTAGRAVTISGSTDSPLVLSERDDALVLRASNKVVAFPSQLTMRDGFPVVVSRHDARGVAIVRREVDRPLQVVERGTISTIGVAMTRSTAVMREIASDSVSDWVVAGAIDAGGGLLITLADLKSDSRLLVRVDDNGVVRACKRIQTPYAVIAGGGKSGLAVAGAWDRGAWVLLYRVRNGAAYNPAETPATCQH